MLSTGSGRSTSGHSTKSSMLKKRPRCPVCPLNITRKDGARFTRLQPSLNLIRLRCRKLTCERLVHWNRPSWTRSQASFLHKKPRFLSLAGSCVAWREEILETPLHNYLPIQKVENSSSNTVSLSILPKMDPMASRAPLISLAMSSMASSDSSFAKADSRHDFNSFRAKL